MCAIISLFMIDISNYFVDTDGILIALNDEDNDKSKEEWKGEIKFQCKPIMLPSSMIEKDNQIVIYALQSFEYVNGDICKYFKDNLYSRLHFNSSEYNYQPEDSSKSKPFFYRSKG